MQRSSFQAAARTLQATRYATTTLRYASTSTLQETSSTQKSAIPQPTTTPAPAIETKPAPSKLLKGVARLLGYNATSTMAARSTNYYYNQLSEQHRRDWDFWYGDCRLQQSFQAWFQITNLYLYFLTVRFRALDKPLGRRFLQELVNHFFIDAEYRMQKDYDIKQSRYIKNTLKTMLAQYHGSTLAYDEALVGSDAMMAAAIWRNVFGTGWGVGMAGVEGKKAPKVQPMAATDGPSFEVEDSEADSTTEEATSLDPATIVKREANFAMVLEKLVLFVRQEVHRLDALPDEIVSNGPAIGNAAVIQFALLSRPVTP